MADREERGVQRHILEPVQEEDHASQKKPVIVAGDHVLGTQVHQRP